MTNTYFHSLFFNTFAFIKLDPDRSLFDQGVKTDGTVQLSVQVVSRQGKQLYLSALWTI